MIAEAMLVMALATDPDPKDQYIEAITEICAEYDGIDPEIIEALIEKESNWNDKAVSRSGAVGLMQIIPKWQGDRMIKLAVEDLSDPYSNIAVGIDYLAELLGMSEDIAEALMIYNSGWAGRDLYKRGYVSKYAYDIIQRAYEIKEEKKADERDNNNTKRDLKMRL